MDTTGADDSPALRDHGSFAHSHAVDPDDIEGTFFILIVRVYCIVRVKTSRTLVY